MPTSQKTLPTKVLYITYDGLTDPLGQSQILPYIYGLAKQGYQFHILSCEKRDRYAQKAQQIRNQLQKNGIGWTSIYFTAKPPIVAKLYDVWQLHKAAIKLYHQHKFNFSHSRSYVATEIAYRLKKQFNLSYIFDMRGFWVNERVDGGLWNTKHFFYRKAFKHYKQKEARYLQAARATVILTEAGKKELLSWPSAPAEQNVYVIPCCADFEHFKLVNHTLKTTVRKQLLIDENAFVLSYLGSIGTWYLLEEMLQFYSVLKTHQANAKMLWLTPVEPNVIIEKAKQYGIQATTDFTIIYAQRSEVPKLMAAADASLCFIAPKYSKIASSPTKLGELLAMGIPTVANTGVGDVAEIIKSTNGGILIEDFKPHTLAKAAKELPKFVATSNPTTIRKKAKEYYQLNRALQQYQRIYKKLESNI